MKIDEKLVEEIAFLARLEIDNKKKIINEMQKIVNYFELLNEVNTDNVEPMYTPIEDVYKPQKRQSRFFEDVDLIRDNFPDREKNYLKVPGIHK
ncbi:glutamyl-tRNA amidotransferase [Thermosipho melanesiensis]|uniref:Aspartyl/glutamyl-tRNA(Asn/Gln) amidotransferase subunit C n=2 Tax=Thermosipho melanesiensis TaxID=46541 RepID=A6LJL8_THEM4|nr:Asp-tRNA(Asn)/Glu-tRNA(Gln) amidotransferase subunit GatC [Thermosipho melanesiensis]ABR30119.1 glutamyl-tRNA(Gln) amidotransferase, C subunit [Thermosipho melanesiensis BI429]APT73316.1 glutamyl-tRNA amidotransferase [Thermosipho melanesiensis]OOC38707.1 glutamyl-tRNA amidotransferase [Thermosipho melanesiensis]OOC40511.1 glutamyl-tRNA amidotransferase [Thermosipho melanesiensis]OOC40776.1 glutamyl-tRNA amidotransferase [Thermosipho melanesiensis]